MSGNQRRPARDPTIGAVSKTTGCNIETIRYYERIGLLEGPPRTTGGHRVYGPQHIKELTFVRRSRELGFGLNEIRSLLRLAKGHDGICEDVREIALGHADDVRRKVRDLRKMERKLRDMASKCAGGDSPVPQCHIIETLFREL